MAPTINVAGLPVLRFNLGLNEQQKAELVAF
jgi:hypothetical protein